MSTTIDEFIRRQEEIAARDHELREECEWLADKKYTVERGSSEYEAIGQRRAEIEKEREALRAERDRLYEERDADITYRTDGFHRPEGHVVSLLNKGLGKLPNRTLVIQPTKEALDEVRPYRLLAFATVCAAVACLIALTMTFPWMAVSPYELTGTLLLSWTGSVVIAGVVPQLIVTLLLLKSGVRVERWPNEGKFLDRAAMLEEQWFRTGAETWMMPQRIYSCAAFGAVHVLNFIYPLASVLVVGGVLGVMAMAVYLREFGRSGDSRLATLASTKFHATYNRFVVVYMVVALGIVAGLPFIA